MKCLHGFCTRNQIYSTLTSRVQSETKCLHGFSTRNQMSTWIQYQKPKVYSPVLRSTVVYFKGTTTGRETKKCIYCTTVLRVHGFCTTQTQTNGHAYAVRAPLARVPTSASYLPVVLAVYHDICGLYGITPSRRYLYYLYGLQFLSMRSTRSTVPHYPMMLEITPLVIFIE
jgi:hypothetical protein